MGTPLISVITPTWQRADLLVKRCIPSVRAQTYPNVEHLVVSDGPDPLLGDYLRSRGETGIRGSGQALWYFELPEHDPVPHWGTPARLHGLEYAAGDLITYIDDDDSLRPGHCAALAAALEANPGAGFAISVMASHNQYGVCEIGRGQVACGNVGTPMIMHRRETLRHGIWGEPSSVEDWDLVFSWMNANVPYVQVDETTCDVWPSVYHGGNR